MPAQVTGLENHRDYNGSTEQLNGLPPAQDQLIYAAEIMAISGAVDNHAGLFDSINAAGAGVAPTIRHSVDGALSIPTSPYHTQPHVIDSGGTATGTLASSGTIGTADYFAGGDFVKHTLANPDAANIWMEIMVDGDKIAWIEGLINGDAEGIYINLDTRKADPTRRTVRLFSGDGSSGWILYD